MPANWGAQPLEDIKYALFCIRSLHETSLQQNLGGAWGWVALGDSRQPWRLLAASPHLGSLQENKPDVGVGAAALGEGVARGGTVWRPARAARRVNEGR